MLFVRNEMGLSNFFVDTIGRGALPIVIILRDKVNIAEIFTNLIGQ